MQQYIALLRGINVSGKNKIKMTALQLLLQDLGLSAVQTYIQSGNVIFNAKSNPAEVLEEKIRDGILSQFGFDVPVLVLKLEEFQKIYTNNTYVKTIEEFKNLYYVLLQNVPKPELVEGLNAMEFANEEFRITDNCIYLNCHKGYGNAKCNNNFFERKLKVVATTRNHKTMTKLLELATT